MNPIAKEALRALHAEGYPTHNHLCQQFAREIVEHALGGRPMGSPNPNSAKDCAMRLLHNGIAFRASELHSHGGLQAGDLVYKTVGSGGDGHVGIFVGNGRIAENSTVHWNETNETDARGIRTLAQFGAFQVVARFPVPHETVVAPEHPLSLELDGKPIHAAIQVEQGQTFVHLRPLAEALGLSVSLDREAGVIALSRKSA